MGPGANSAGRSEERGYCKKDACRGQAGPALWGLSARAVCSIRPATAWRAAGVRAARATTTTSSRPGCSTSRSNYSPSCATPASPALSSNHHLEAAQRPGQAPGWTHQPPPRCCSTNSATCLPTPALVTCPGRAPRDAVASRRSRPTRSPASSRPGSAWIPLSIGGRMWRAGLAATRVPGRKKQSGPPGSASPRRPGLSQPTRMSPCSVCRVSTRQAFGVMFLGLRAHRRSAPFLSSGRSRTARHQPPSSAACSWTPNASTEPASATVGSLVTWQRAALTQQPSSSGASATPRPGGPRSPAICVASATATPRSRRPGWPAAPGSWATRHSSTWARIVLSMPGAPVAAHRREAAGHQITGSVPQNDQIFTFVIAKDHSAAHTDGSGASIT